MNPNIEILESICRQSDLYSKSSDWSEAEKFFKESIEKWNSGDTGNSLQELREKFDANYRTFCARHEIHTQKKRRIVEREILCAEIERLIGIPGHESLDRVEDLTKEWYQMELIPPEFMEILQKRFDRSVKAYFLKKNEIDAELMKLRSKKTEMDKICERAESLAANSKFSKEDSNEMKSLQEKLEITLSGLSEFDSHTERFKKAAAEYERRKEETRKNLAAAAADEEKKLEMLCEELKNCLAAEDLRSVLPKVKELKSRFRPSELKYSGKRKLIETYDSLLHEFHSKLKAKFEEEDWARWEHYTYKLDLCEKAEQLALEQDFYNKSRTLSDLRKEWKDIGAVPREKSEEIWERFNSTCEKIYLECQNFFKNLDTQRSENYSRKVPICEEIEKLADSSEWETAAEKIKQLRDDFLTIGPAPKEKETELRDRIKTVCDRFFGKRKEYYKELHQMQSESRNAKSDLCEAAEKLAEMDKPDAIRKTRELRTKWRESGSASYKDEKKLWERFNGAIENFFKGLDDERTKNTEAKKTLCEELQRVTVEATAKSPGEIENKISELRKAWNEIGYGSRGDDEKLADNFFSHLSDLQKIYRDKLRESQSKMEQNFQGKIALIEKIENNPEDPANTPESLSAEWTAAGELPPGIREKLEAHFKALLDAITSSNSQFFAEIRQKRGKILDKRRKLCVELEKITGMSAQGNQHEKENDEAPGGVSLDMLNELKFALETNVTLGRKKTDSKEAADRVKDVESQWKKLESLPCREEEELATRFNEILSKFKKQQNSRR